MATTTELVRILIEADDHASKQLKAVARGMDGLARPALKLTSVLGGVGKVAAGLTFGAAVAGVGALGAVFASSIGEARDAARAMAQTQAVIKSTGGAAGLTADQIADMAGALSKTTLFTDDAIQADENLLLTFTNIKNAAGENNDIFTQATKVSLDLAQAMGTDAAGAAIQLGKALNDPAQGISALTRVGVTFSEEQQDLIKTMVAAGDTMGAQKIILAELNKEFGGSAEAAAAADGGWHLFQQRLSDVAQEIGEALMPALTTMLTWLSGPGLSMIETFGKGVATWISETAVPAFLRLVNTISGIGKHVQEAFAEGGIKAAIDTLLFDVGKVVPGLEPTTTFLRDVAPGAIDASKTAWQRLTDSVETFKEAWAGDWKNAETILPLHSAIGQFGLIAGDVFRKLANEVLPELAKEFATSMPENQRLVNVFAAYLDEHFFPNYNAGMNAAEKATRDYGVEVGKTTGAATKSWADYAFNQNNELDKTIKKAISSGTDIHNAFLTLQGWMRDQDTAWQTLSSNSYSALNTMAANVATKFGEMWGHIHRVTEAVNDLYNRLTATIGLASRVHTPGGGGGGGGSGFGEGGGSSGGGSQRQPGGGTHPEAQPQAIHYNFYGPTDGDSVVKELRSVGMG